MNLTNLSSPASWLFDLFRGNDSEGSVPVNEHSCLENAPFWYGVNRISGNVASLPINCRRRLDRGSEKATDHIGQRLMRRRPNPYQTPIVFKQSLMKHAIMWGNGRAVIHFDGPRSELIPMMPDRTITGMVDGEKWHLTKPYRDDRLTLFQDIESDPTNCVLRPDAEVLHIQGFGDGVVGLSLIEMARKSMQISLGADRRAANQMNKGFAGKVMLEVPEESNAFRDQKQAEEFLEDFKKRHGANGAADDVGMLRGGIKANVMQMSNRDSQFIDLRMFQREETALWLMLETILGNKDSVSYNSEEQRQIAYLVNCLATWLVRIEEECNVKLLTKSEFDNDTHYFKFNVGPLLRTDMSTTIETFSKAIAARIYNPNECRDKLDENPYEGGDEYINPAISKAGESEQPNSAVVARMSHMMKIEQKRVNQFIDRDAPYDEIEKWYESWSKTLANAIEALGGDDLIAQEHCVESLKSLASRPKSFDLDGVAEKLAKEIDDA